MRKFRKIDWECRRFVLTRFYRVPWRSHFRIADSKCGKRPTSILINNRSDFGNCSEIAFGTTWSPFVVAESPIPTQNRRFEVRKTIDLDFNK